MRVKIKMDIEDVKKALIECKSHKIMSYEDAEKRMGSDTVTMTLRIGYDESNNTYWITEPLSSRGMWVTSHKLKEFLELKYGSLEKVYKKLQEKGLEEVEFFDSKVILFDVMGFI